MCRRKAITEKCETRQHLKHSKPRINKRTEEGNVIPCLYRQAARENKTRKREKVIYSRFATGKKNKTKCFLFQIIWIALRCRSLSSCVSEAGLNGFQWGSFSPPWMHLLFYARHTRVSREHIIAPWGNQRTSYCVSRSRLIDFKKFLGRLSHFWVSAAENRNVGHLLPLCSWKGIPISSVQ